jgi:hypothetical protein
MAEPTTFPQANLELIRPATMTAEECSSLPVYRSAEPQAFISCWRPTAEDLERLVRGGAIWVRVIGSSHPPIAVTTENPFGEQG